MTGLVFSCGFDAYGPAGNQNAASVMAGDWSVSGTPAVVAGLSATGYAVQLSTVMTMTAALPSAMTRISGSIRFRTDSATIGTRFLFQTGVTAVFAITLNAATGAIELRTGSQTGTIIATSGAVAIGTIHVLSFDVTVGAAGAYAFHLDGGALYSGTGNTGNGQTSVNTFVLGNGAGALTTIDDIALFNPLAAGYDSSMLTASVVVETQWPSGDAQKQFTSDGNVLWPTGIAADGVYQATTFTSSLLANSLFLLKVTPTVNCTLVSVSFMPNASNAAAKYRAVVYSDSSGAPNILLSSGTEVVGVTAGTSFVGVLTTPQSLTAGTPVWIGIITDTATNLRHYDNLTNLGQRKAVTYTSGAPASAGTMVTGQPTFLFWGNCTGAAVNAVSVMLNPPHTLAAGSQVRGTAAAQKDLFSFPALSNVPSAIYGVAVKGFVHKSDSGTRTVSLPMRSGGTDSDGSAASQAMSTTGQWQRSLYPTDPATGAAWTAAGVNAASAGVSVAT